MSIYRNAVWFMKGLSEYTKSGYEAAAKHFIPSDLEVNVTGRSFMITGANSGIGKAVATAIAKRGGIVHMVCRNKDRAEEAKEEIVKESSNENVFVHILDMSNPRRIWQFAQKFSQENKSLNVLVNNAGCMVNQRELTEDGLEKNFATNTLGTYILTTALIPLLETSEAPRVRQQVILTEQWAKLHKNIHFSVMHPGWADTPAVRSSMPDFYEKMKNRLRTEAQGADTVVWLAVSPAASHHPSGLFFQDRKPVSTHLPLAQTRSSQEEEEKLLKSLQQLTEKFKNGSL
ncbi:dehydrogenase/reductase SDR family member 12 isoform X2 [Protopterus annectens]|uniref:dehydrogenase/reductase SDR family member 12 isoform X2 n=1 Tax=Protopterus annectens TaxID=7888 RepID=UPI001CFB1184|nr:dehydrogenase/reductase SDR family member 12 isoform X2 [Protopterus annectens]